MQYIQRKTCLVHARANTRFSTYVFCKCCMFTNSATYQFSKRKAIRHTCCSSLRLTFFINTQFLIHPCLSTSYKTNFLLPCNTTRTLFIYILSVYVCVSEHFIRINTRSTQTLCGRCDRILYKTFINYYLLLNGIKVVLCLNKNNTLNRNRTS